MLDKYVGNTEPELSYHWYQLRHHLGRLHSLRQASETIVQAFKEWPELFKDFTVNCISSSRLRKFSYPPELHALLMEIIKATFPGYDPSNYDSDIEEHGLYAQIQKQEEEFPSKTQVHGEVNLHNHLMKTGKTRSCDLWEGVMFIATSKPPFRLCYYYFQHGDNDFQWLSQNQAAQKNGMPQTTLSSRLRGLPSRSEITQPAQLLSKSQESRVVTWILRQEALGYAPSHSQVRATVAALLRQQGRERHIGVHWLARFIKRHPDIETKVGKRQEAARFNSFTPMAVNWYFGIRESEYGWIKRENTVNVDEGGIMAGFGLDSLVIGSSDPRRKAFLKGSQSRTWTTFIEAVTVDGRLLKPGIIFKGKELQQQWFIDEFRKIADWYYITSDNGWTDNHIAVERLKEVYLPQTQPADKSDARLVILDGHGSHVPDEWMATLQPLDNGVFNASKTAYRKELQKLTSLTDSAPVDKVNFLKAYARARAVGMTKKNILSGWRVTGNWPISRRKALMHPEIQPDKKEMTPGSDSHRDGQVDSDHTPTTSRHIRDLGKNKSPSTRRRYSVISRGFEVQESKIASLGTRIASLEEEVGRLSRGKKRKAIPNANKRFMKFAEALVAGDAISEPNEAIERADAVEDVIEAGGMEEDEGSN
ncbi:hypothetical protein ACKAV7_014644 [Fusarium commune]